MAEEAALFLELQNTHHARHLGVVFRDLVSQGILQAGDLAAAQRAAGANMSVDVAKGAAYVLGTEDADKQPCYRCFNDATVNLAIAAADATKPRVDRIIARVYDQQFSGALNKWDLEVLTGVPAVGATHTNLTGALAIPNNALELARVEVAALQANVVNANIFDVRTLSRVGGGGLLVPISSLVGYPADATKVPKGDGSWGTLSSLLTLVADSKLGAAGTFDVQNIPGNPGDALILEFVGRSSDGAPWLALRFNHDNGGNYFWQNWGAVTNAPSFTGGLLNNDTAWTNWGFSMENVAPASYAGSVDCVIPDYAGTDFYKAATAESGAPNYDNSNSRGFHSSIVWKNQAAITRIELLANSTIAANSRLTIHRRAVA